LDAKNLPIFLVNRPLKKARALSALSN